MVHLVLLVWESSPFWYDTYKLTKGEELQLTERFYLYDDTIETRTRFISFMGGQQRIDLALMQTDRFYGKQLVLDMQRNRFAIIGQDDLEEDGYLEHAFNLSEEEAAELKDFLEELV